MIRAIPRHAFFRALGILDALDFVPVGDFYQVRGHLFEPPFSLPHGFDAARHALASRFPSHRMAFGRLFERIEAVQDGLALVGEQHDKLVVVPACPQAAAETLAPGA